MNFKGTNFLSADQITSIETVDTICSLASRLEIISSRKKSTNILKGAILANLFFESSTRTRASFATAFSLLGGSIIDISDVSASSMVKGESLFDTGRVMSAYADIVVMRHPKVEALDEFVSGSQVPVINGGNGVGEHPTQAMLDVYTILKERGEPKMSNLDNLTVCIVGDLKHGRTVHSLSKLLSLCGGINFKLVSPQELKMPHAIVDLLKQRHNQVLETADLREGVAGADVIYVTRVQQERFASPEEYNRYAGKYSIDKAFYEQYCLPHAILMHPLPRDSRLANPELNVDLNDHPNLAIYRQAQNGVPVRMALFCLLLGVEKKIFDNLTDVMWR